MTVTDHRQPLLLLPGFLCDEDLWRDQLAGLADVADCRVADLGHADSIAALAQQVLATAPPRFALAGFSFGGYVSIANAVRLRADALVSIAPPVGRWPFDAIALPTCPWLIVQGEADEIVEPQAVFDWVETLEQRPELVRMPETSHFFHRRLMDLRGAVKHAVHAWLPPPRHA